MKISTEDFTDETLAIDDIELMILMVVNVRTNTSGATWWLYLAS